jgi:hypothetical protein
MLTLDPMTLFYWSLSDPPPKRMKYSVESWAKTIPSNAKPASRDTSRANSVKTGKASTTKRNGSTGTGTAPPALTSASSRSKAASSASVLTPDITITNVQVPGAVKIKQDNDAIYTYDGALSDCEETAGAERDLAIASPNKGKRRLTSEVSASYDMNSCT